MGMRATERTTQLSTNIRETTAKPTYIQCTRLTRSPPIMRTYEGSIYVICLLDGGQQWPRCPVVPALKKHKPAQRSEVDMLFALEQPSLHIRHWVAMV